MPLEEFRGLPTNHSLLFGVDAAGVPTTLKVNSSGLLATDSSFIPSIYAADLTMNGTAQVVAIASGATKLRVFNRGVTTEAIRLAFGANSSEAQANLTIVAAAATSGLYIPAPIDGHQGAQIIGIPKNATHFAIANALAADVQVVSIELGI